MKRKITIELLTWIPVLLLSFAIAVVGERFGNFGLSPWQFSCVTFALGAALYRGVTSPLVDLYIVWDLTRKARRSSDSTN
ncbi:hypothetical protein PSP6_540071 [Paraburkholderia tropica]|uniref:hypothetical protein n=1 Tax=Paraburkholderia tropica TaxID=92647 RepID=UPI001CB251E6|nr:hypothetical protein [Paraburkholderia tropica]CAG9230201.1 hypothetical protein PSP6_540071 [Paraburkholderia tropica]